METTKKPIKWDIDKVRQFVEVESGSGCVLISKQYKTANSKYEFKCLCGKSFERTFRAFNHQKQFQCRNCAGVKDWNIETVKKYVEVGSNSKCILLSTEYKNVSAKLRLKCHCGSEFNRSFTKFKDSKRHTCSKCSIKRVADLQRKTHDQFIQEVYSIHGNEYKILSEYTGAKNKITVRHNSPICNYREYEIPSEAILTKGCRECHYVLTTGENHPRWNFDLTEDERIRNRDYTEYHKWRISVYERDNFTCQCCGDKGGRLAAHHILNFAEHRELRIEISNGITLCDEKCHRTFHNEYGYTNNNGQQLDEFINKKRIKSA